MKASTALKKKADVTAQDKFNLSNAVKKILVTKTKKCDEASERNVELRPTDPLAFARNTHDTFLAAMRLVPINGETIELRFPTVPGRPPTLTARLHSDETVKGASVVCEATDCRVQFVRSTPWTRAQWKFDVTVDSPGKPLPGPVFYAKDGSLVSKEGEKFPVSKWLIPADLQQPFIPPNPGFDRPIPLDPRLAFLLADEEYLQCNKIGGPKPTEKCARFVREAGPLFTLFDRSAVTHFQTDSAAQEFSLEPHGAQVADPKTAKFTVTTFRCEYEFNQLTRAVGGVEEAEVLYWVTAQRSGCLGLAPQVRASSAQGTSLTTRTSWLERNKSFDGGLLSVRFSVLPKVPDTPEGVLRVKLAARQGYAADAPDMNLKFDGQFEVNIEKGLETEATKPDVSIGATREKFLTAQSEFAVDRENRIGLPKALAKYPWLVEIGANGDYRPELPPSMVTNARIAIPLPSGRRFLPYVVGAQDVQYYLTATDDDGPPSLNAHLQRTVEELLVSGASGEIIRTNLGAKANALLKGKINAGHARVEFKQGARRYRLPWSLRDAAVICDDVVPLTHGGMVRGLKKNDYPTCHLVVGVPSDVDFKDQHLLVHVKHEGESGQGTPVRVLREDSGRNAKVKDYCKQIARSQTCKVFPLDIRLGKVSDYSIVTITVSHAKESDPQLSAALKDARIPTDGTDERYKLAKDADLVVQTRLIPDWTVRWRDGGTWGPRFYGTVTANLSVANSRPDGYGRETSSNYAQALETKFGGGFLGVVELWNFSENSSAVPLQLMGGAMFTLPFTRAHYWEEVTLVGGLGVRLPASRAPGNTGIEAGTSLIGWFATHPGGRNGDWVNSFLLGVNVNLGAGAL